MKNYASASVVGIMSLTILLSACNEGSKLTERNKASVLKSNDEMFIKGNLGYADEVISADYVVEDYGKGPAYIKTFVKERREAFPDLEIKVEPLIAEGNMVAWLRTQSGTLKNNYWGYSPTGKKITWKEMVFTRYGEDGKIAEEWALSNALEMLQAANDIDGVYEYLPPGKGQSVNRNGRFVYLFGSPDGKGMTSQAGTYTISGDTVKNTITCSTDPKLIGAVYWWKVKSWSGDTVSYNTMNDKSEITGGGRAIRVSR